MVSYQFIYPRGSSSTRRDSDKDIGGGIASTHLFRVRDSGSRSILGPFDRGRARRSGRESRQSQCRQRLCRGGEEEEGHVCGEEDGRSGREATDTEAITRAFGYRPHLASFHFRTQSMHLARPLHASGSFPRHKVSLPLSKRDHKRNLGCNITRADVRLCGTRSLISL